MGACREQSSKQESETCSAYQPWLHLLLLPSLSEHFFLTGYNCCSPLIYHTEELNVDTSKYFHTHGSLGHVFSPCLKWNSPIHHWLFATEAVFVYMRVCVRTRHVSVSTCALDDCVTLLKMSHINSFSTSMLVRFTSPIDFMHEAPKQ